MKEVTAGLYTRTDPKTQTVLRRHGHLQKTQGPLE